MKSLISFFVAALLVAVLLSTTSALAEEGVCEIYDHKDGFIVASANESVYPPEMQFFLGRQYFGGYAGGYGVRMNKRKAVRWFHLAAQQGYAEAQYNLGVMYADGDGIVKNERKAAYWLCLAAEQGNDSAKLRLSAIQSHGKENDSASRDSGLIGVLSAEKFRKRRTPLQKFLRTHGVPLSSLKRRTGRVAA